MSAKRLSIPELEAVLLVAEHLSFRVAAEHAHLSQPALSRRVQAAERKLNAKLFDRDKHRVSLTDAGSELIPIAHKIISEFHDSLSDLSEFIAGRRGLINIWTLPSVAAAVLPQAVLAFQNSNPQVRLAVQAASAGQVEAAVLEGVADIGLTIEHQASSADLLFTPLLNDHFVMICSKDHPLAMHRVVDWKVFAQYPFIASGPVSSIRQVTDQVLSSQMPQVQYVIDNVSVVGAMVAAGAGIAAVPKLALRLMDTNQLQNVPLRSPAATREIGILVHSKRSLSTAASHFIDTLRRCGLGAGR